MADKTLIIDDISHYEAERLIEMIQTRHILRRHQGEVRRPERWACRCKQLHSYDYGGPYAAFRGRHQLLPGDRPHGERQHLVAIVKAPWQETRELAAELRLRN